MAETIRPFNTIYDGDVFFSASTDDFEIKFTDKACEISKKLS